MAEDFDVEAMLEEPFNKISTSSSNSNNKRERERERERSDAFNAKDLDNISNKHKDDNDASNGTRRRHRTRSRSKSKDRARSKNRDHSRDRARTKERERERSKGRDRSKERERRSRDKERERPRRDSDRDRQQQHRDVKRSSRDKERRRSRSRDDWRGGNRYNRGNFDRRRDWRSSKSQPDRNRSRSRDRRRPSKERKHTPPIKEPTPNKERASHRRSFSPRPFRRGRTPPNSLGNRSPGVELSSEERDARTVFCIQLSQRVRARDLEEFFSSVGKVRDVRLITCNKTKRFKGIAYIEFRDPESVALALGLSGQKLLGVPIMVQHTQAEKNRLANSVPVFTPKPHTGPLRLYVGSLHFNITEDMLRGIFEPYGKIDNIQLIADADGRSKGYGFITFHNADDAKKALEQLNGFELAGRPMKVGNVTDRLDISTPSLDTDEMDRSGIELGATGRLQLMFKLAETAGLAVPQAAANALLATAPQPQPVTQPEQPMPNVATQCFILSNMFDPRTETNPAWDLEIRDDVLDECDKHGGVLHIYVDKTSAAGNVYVKCPRTAVAVLAVNALHGRWFAGRIITAAYVPVVNYHGMFPDSSSATEIISSSRKAE